MASPGSLTDESVDTFYTCNLCQSIAGGHLCVISPEHTGVCGAVDWMDARAAISIRPVGPNEAVKKDGLIDAPYSQNIYAIQNCGKKQPDLAGKMERLIYRWKRKRDGLVLCMAGGLHSG